MKVTTEQFEKPCGCRSAGECFHNVSAPFDALDALVDQFAARMKIKLKEKALEGRSGWDDPEWKAEDIRLGLNKHVNKGDPIDVANFAAFLWNRGLSAGSDPDLVIAQRAIWNWCLDTFEGIVNWRDRRERTFRFMEEAIELFQALGLPREDVDIVANYVYGRPGGLISQEVGGVLITLLALCENEGVDAWGELGREYDRIATPEMRAKIREKQLAKRQALV